MHSCIADDISIKYAIVRKSEFEITSSLIFPDVVSDQMSWKLIDFTSYQLLTDKRHKL